MHAASGNPKYSPQESSRIFNRALFRILQALAPQDRLRRLRSRSGG
jgi:hypothetical protein